MSQLDKKDIVIPAPLLSDARLTGTEKLVLLQILVLAGNNIICHPTNRKLAELLGLTIRTVERMIKKLKEKEFIKTWNTGNYGRRIEIQAPMPISQYFLISNGYEMERHWDKNQKQFIVIFSYIGFEYRVLISPRPKPLPNSLKQQIEQSDIDYLCNHNTGEYDVFVDDNYVGSCLYRYELVKLLRQNCISLY